MVAAVVDVLVATVASWSCSGSNGCGGCVVT